MKIGDVVRTTSINVHLGQPDPAKYRELWRTKRGYRYVFVLLGIEDKPYSFDPVTALESMGWKRKKEKLNGQGAKANRKSPA